MSGWPAQVGWHEDGSVSTGHMWSQPPGDNGVQSCPLTLSLAVLPSSSFLSSHTSFPIALNPLWVVSQGTFVCSDSNLTHLDATLSPSTQGKGDWGGQGQLQSQARNFFENLVELFSTQLKFHYLPKPGEWGQDRERTWRKGMQKRPGGRQLGQGHTSKE